MFECHITCERPNDTTALEALAAKYSWKTSYIVGDPLLGTGGFFYFTAYDTDLVNMKLRMHEMADRISVRVLRKKIEQIVYDTKKLEAA